MARRGRKQPTTKTTAIFSEKTKKDIVIPVMGPTGAGKSTFINALLKENRMKVGYQLSSCTSELGFGFIETIHGFPELADHRIVIVDTPGFDDTYKGDTEILKKIAEWLEDSYRQRAILGGVIYLHDVTSDRFTGTARRNLEMFQLLCGQEALSKVVIGTTKWGRIDREIAQQHHVELQDVHWKPLVRKGSLVRQFDDTPESAWDFIHAILRKIQREKLFDVALRIQTELAKDKKLIPETEAGQQLRFTLKEVLDMQKSMAAMEKSMAEGGDQEAQAKVQEAEEKIQLLAKQIRELKIDRLRRFKFWKFLI